MFRNPLCKPKQIPYVIHVYLYFLSHGKKLKPVQCHVDAETEKILANEFGWSSLTTVAEERINLTKADPEKCDKNFRKRLHCAEKSGIKLTDVIGLVDHKVKKEIDECVEDWKHSKKGTQVHLTSVRPWDDEVHCKYFSSWDATDNICTMVVLAQLSVSWLPDQVGIGVPWHTAGNNQSKLGQFVVTYISCLIKPSHLKSSTPSHEVDIYSVGLMKLCIILEV